MSQTWNLKKASTDENLEVIIGRFQDPIEMDKSKNLYMYMQEESVDDDDVDVADDGAPKKKKKKRKINAKPKMYINLEEVSSSKSSSDHTPGIHVLGNLVETSTEGGNPANYALLQVVKKEGSSNEMTIRVIEVGDWYHFRKPDVARPVMSLDEIDTQFEMQKKYQKGANKKYKKILSALERIVPENAAEVGSAPEVFGSKAPKGGRRGAVMEASGRVADNEEDGEDVDAHERAFGELEAQEYEKEASDDEEDVRAQQAQDHIREDNDLDGGTAWDDVDLDSSDEDDDESSDEEETAEEALKVDSLVLATAELKDHMAAAAAAKALGAAGRSSSPVVTTSDARKKRPRDSGSAAAAASVAGALAGAGAGSEVGGAAKKGRISGVNVTQAGAAAPPPSAPVAAKAMLTEEMVREAVTRLGGRANSKNLFNELKKPMKKMGDSGKTRLKDILKSIAVVEKDPVMGTVFVLKK